MLISDKFKSNKKQRTTPGIKSALFALFFIPLFISLGFWQIHRGEYKKTLNNQLQFCRTQPVVQYSSIPSERHPSLEYCTVKLQGQYDFSRQILVDNKINNHQLGYYVLTPLKLLADGQLILVNRGWLSKENKEQVFNRSNPTERLSIIQGEIRAPESVQFILGNNFLGQTNEWPIIIQKIDISALSKYFGRPLIPKILYLDPKDSNGFERNWQAIILNPSKHFGYAIQWFSMAVTLLILTLYSYFVREDHDK